METPKDKKELHTFLGMATYMSSFIPKLADHTAPLRGLLKENVEIICMEFITLESFSEGEVHDLYSNDPGVL